MNIKIVSMLFALLIVPIFCVGQQLKPSTNLAQYEITCEKNWRYFDAGNVWICVPDEIQFKQKQGVDQSFWHYESPTTEIDIFTGARAPILLQERSLSSFRSSRRWIGDVPVEYADFMPKTDGNLKFTQTARVLLATKPVPNFVMIYIKFQDETYSSIAEKILNSIHVKN